VEWMKFDKIISNLYRDVTLVVHVADLMNPGDETTGYYKFKVRADEPHWYERLLFDVDRTIPLRANFSLQYHTGQKLQEVGQHGILFDNRREATLHTGSADAPSISSTIRNDAVRYGWVQPAAKAGVVSAAAASASAAATENGARKRAKGGIVELSDTVLRTACAYAVEAAIDKFEQFAAVEMAKKSPLIDSEEEDEEARSDGEEFNTKVSAAAKWSLLFRDGNAAKVRDSITRSFLESTPYVRAAGCDVCRNEEVPFVNFTSTKGVKSATSLDKSTVAAATEALESEAPKQVSMFWNVAGIPNFSSLIFDFSDKLAKSMRQTVRSVYNKYPSAGLVQMKESLRRNLDIFNHESDGYRIFENVVGQKHALFMVGESLPSSGAKQRASSQQSTAERKEAATSAKFSKPIVPPSNMKSLLAASSASFLESEEEEDAFESPLIMPANIGTEFGRGEALAATRAGDSSNMFEPDGAPTLFNSSDDESDQEEQNYNGSRGGGGGGGSSKGGSRNKAPTIRRSGSTVGPRYVGGQGRSSRMPGVKAGPGMIVKQITTNPGAVTYPSSTLPPMSGNTGELFFFRENEKEINSSI
jgi:hypothetical protein